MRTHLTSLVVGVLVVLSVLAPASVSAAPGARYLDPVFDEVTVTHDVAYGAATSWVGTRQTLRLDIYEPAGDPATGRPAVVWVHGGSFASGTKSDPLEVDWGTDLARHGYVAVSIQYRLRSGPSQGSIRDAQHDAQAAVRWLRAHADELRIDPARIGISGYSAGGVTAIEVAQSSHDTGASGNPGYSSWVCFAASQAGGTLPDVDARDTPVAFFHGTTDTIVPYALAQLDHRSWQAAGIPTWFWSYDGGHLAPLANTADVRSKLYPLLAQHLVDSDCAEPPIVPGGSLHPVAARLADTRVGLPLGPGESRVVQVGGRSGVPAGARAALVNLTAIAPTDATHLTVSVAGTSAAPLSNLNVEAGETRAVAVLSELSAGGAITVRNNTGATHVTVDLVGWFDGGGAASSGGRLLPLEPTRLVDSRRGLGLAAIGPRATADLGVAGNGPVSVDATGLVANLTLVGPLEATHLTAFPSGTSRSATSTVNAPAFGTAANLTVVELGGGSMSLFNNAGATHVLVDALGQVRTTGTPGAPTASSSTGRITSTPPTRLLDSRGGVNTVAAPLGPGEVRTFDVRGLGGLPPDGIAAVVLGVTGTGATGSTHLVVAAGDLPALPRSSNLNLVPGRATANLVLTAVGADGTVSIRNDAATTHVIVDVVGFVAA